MARHGDVTLGWADGEYRFRLAWAQLIAVQEACNAGPAEILARLGSDRWRVQDIEAPILHGLLGADTTPDRARLLVRIWVQGRPLLENVAVAQAILSAALVGDPLGEDEGEMPAGKPAPSPTPSATGASASPT